MGSYLSSSRSKPLLSMERRFYATDPELRRLFKSVNGLIFPGGLTDLYIDDPYVIAAKKLHSWAAEANDAGEVRVKTTATPHMKARQCCHETLCLTTIAWHVTRPRSRPKTQRTAADEM